MYLVRVHPTYRWSAATIAATEFVKHQARELPEITEELQHAADVGILEITEMATAEVVQNSSAESGKNSAGQGVAMDDQGAVAQPELPVVAPRPRRKKVTDG